MHDGGVLHGAPMTHCLMIQRKEVGALLRPSTSSAKAGDLVPCPGPHLSHPHTTQAHRSAGVPTHMVCGGRHLLCRSIWLHGAAVRGAISHDGLSQGPRTSPSSCVGWRCT